MYGTTRKDRGKAFRLHRDRADGRPVLSVCLLLALLTASTVVSADAILRLPELLLTSGAAIDADMGPRLPDATAGDSGLAASTEPSPKMLPVVADAFPLTQVEDDTNPSEFSRQLQAHDYAEGWRQAGIGVDRLGSTFRAHQIVVSTEGQLTGQIVALDALTGDLRPLADQRIRILRLGILVATSRTDEAGYFEVAGLTTGTYSLIAAGDDSLLSYALHVLVSPDTDHGVENEPVSPEHKPGIRLLSAAITGADVAAALSKIATLQTDDIVGVSPIEPPIEMIPDPVRPLEQSGTLGTPLWSHRVQLQADGRLIGRVRHLHPESGRPLLSSLTRVMLLQDGRKVAEGLTDERGCFEIRNAAPGVYSLVAVTIDEEVADNVIDYSADPTEPVGLIDNSFRQPGYATFAIDVLPAGNLRHVDQSILQLVGEASAVEPLELDFALINANDMVAYTGIRVSEKKRGRSTFWGDKALVKNQSSRLAPRSAANPPSQPPGHPQGGGGPIGWNLPLLPPDTFKTNTMSPNRL